MSIEEADGNYGRFWLLLYNNNNMMVMIIMMIILNDKYVTLTLQEHYLCIAGGVCVCGRVCVDVCV